MSKNIVALIGGYILIGSIFLPILSINTTYKGWSVSFNYWLVGLMQATSENVKYTSGTEFQPNLIGIGCATILVVFGTLIIVKALIKGDSTLILIFGILSIIIIAGTTLLMYVIFVNAMKSSDLGDLSSFLVPSFGFYSAIIGGALAVIGGAIRLKNV